MYFGNITRTSYFSLLKYLGREPATSANPPVLIKGTASDVAKSIFFMILPPILTVCPVLLPLYRILPKKESTYLFLYSNLIVSAINATNSEFVGFPLPLLTV